MVSKPQSGMVVASSAGSPDVGRRWGKIVEAPILTTRIGLVN
jgi:hypothetical protein